MEGFGFRMRLAVIGSGISGNAIARLLAVDHCVDLFEAGDHVGGHAHTVNVSAYGRQVDADVAFMVLNERTYPNLCKMFSLLSVRTQDSDMSLSVRCQQTGLEYQGSSLNGLFAQRANLFRPSFYRMMAQILRFNREATAFCDGEDDRKLLGEFLDDLGMGSMFREKYLLPMSAAIWSADPACLELFPAKFILGFFRNHGLLQIQNRPQWKTVSGRSKQYVKALVKPISHRIKLSTPVSRVLRVKQKDGAEAVQLEITGESPKQFDHVVFACHADQALKLLSDASQKECDILGGFPYQANRAILHTDPRCLPTRKHAWASWNYHIPQQPTDCVSVTYDLNRLQQLGLPGPLCLTLNPSDEIQQQHIINEFEFTHPAFTLASIDSQRRFDEISGLNGVSFCGAYWGYGFHEDGLKSALAVGRQFGLTLEDLTRPISMANRVEDSTSGDAASSEKQDAMMEVLANRGELALPALEKADAGRNESSKTIVAENGGQQHE